MSDPASRLPLRPSLEQLRKQAKERLRQQRLSDPGATLAQAQFTLAREYGFESWPRLVQHLRGLARPGRLVEFERIAGFILAGAGGDEPALQRLIEYTGSSYNFEQLRIRVVDWLKDVADQPSPDRWTIEHARLVVARQYGYQDWNELVAALSAPSTRAASTGHSPPFYDIDHSTGTIELRPPIAEDDWERLVEVIEDSGLSGLHANGQMTDSGLERISRLEQLTRLNLDGSQRLSDDGLAHLGRMTGLEDLDLSGWHMRFTDRGLDSLRQLKGLKRFSACWPQRITDAGVAHLAACEGLEAVNLMGTRTGDGAVAALADKPRLGRVSLGKLLSDSGLSLLQRFPLFRTWQAGTPPTYGLMAPDAGPTFLLLDGAITDEGIRRLAGLEGLFGLSFFWHLSSLTPAALEHLNQLPNLGMLGCQDALCNDVAMGHIGSLPSLRMLMAQGTVAGDEGFVALSRSRTLEHIWGRDSGHLGSRGFRALAEIPSLKGLAVSCAGVDDDALATLPSFPALSALVPMDVTDSGFRHVGGCAGLENLWCMYCRDTGDRATEPLAGLGKLRTYYAGKTRITDRSLEILGRLSSLEELEFWQIAGITNAGLASLAALPRLRKITIDGSARITREGVRVFPGHVSVRYRG